MRRFTLGTVISSSYLPNTIIPYRQNPKDSSRGKNKAHVCIIVSLYRGPRELYCFQVMAEISDFCLQCVFFSVAKMLHSMADWLSTWQSLTMTTQQAGVWINFLLWCLMQIDLYLGCLCLSMNCDIDYTHFPHFILLIAALINNSWVHQDLWSISDVPTARGWDFTRCTWVLKCPKSQSWTGVLCTNPQQGVKECTFCSGSDLNYLLRDKFKHKAYLHPRQVALNRRVGHGDAGWICTSSNNAEISSASLVFTVPAVVRQC